MGNTVLISDLFERVLIDPAEHADRLYIVSGYATPAMAFHHLNKLRDLGKRVNVELIMGMCSAEGIGQSHHSGFKSLVENDFNGLLKCSYLKELPPVHTKMYAWYSGDTPVAGFTGSANYTQSAFGRRQREMMEECSPEECLEYFRAICGQTIYCNHIDVENQINVYNDRDLLRRRRQMRLTEDTIQGPATPIEGLDCVTISLLDSRGALPARSGLNWGQRPEYNREPNQAYIRVPIDIARRRFFPPRSEDFTVLTDDGKTIVCTIAQDNDKAIESPQNNSMIGEYFRNRLGLASGAPVDTSDLVRYGRIDVVFCKIDPETYYMDFSPPST